MTVATKAAVPATGADWKRFLIIVLCALTLLSLLFINVFHLGVDGSGFSYITARVLGMGLALIWLLTHNVALSRSGI